MSRKKISTTIYVTPEQSERLRLLHERTKVPVAVYIREGIDLVLRQYGHLLPGQLPLDGGSVGGRRGQDGEAAHAGSPARGIGEVEASAGVSDKAERAASGSKG
jgi:hypothetical protein